MADTLEPHVTPSSRRRRWVAPLVAAVGAVAAIAIGVGIGLAVADRDDTPDASTAIGQLAEIRQACGSWMHGQATDRPGADWCDEMTDWMGRQLTDGSMMGPMMWGSADRMLATCRAWMDAAPSAAAPTGWCDDMMHGMWPDADDDGNGGMRGPMMGG